MDFRSRARSFFIRAVTLARADELVLRVDNLKSQSHGLVVAMHETPVGLAERFREQLHWVSRHFTIATLETFAQLWNDCGEKKTISGRKAKPPVLFTFDDGRESNYTVAAPMLESFGGRGLFFVVPAFADCAPDEALAYYRSRINPDSKPGDEAWEDWKPMNPAQITDLAARGHAIGNHTLTHRRLAELSNESLEHEIGDGSRKLAEWTHKPVDAFGWTFGWDAIDARAWNVIRKYHRFCFAPCPGEVDIRVDTPALLWRREIELKYSAAEYRFQYSGLVDPWWASRRKRLRRMLRAQTE